MSNSYTIGDLFSMYYENEFSSVEDIELPDFSAKHKRKMKKAFRIFCGLPRKTQKIDKQNTKNPPEKTAIRRI